MTYTHTSIPVELTEQAFCDDCKTRLYLGALARRRVTDTGKQGFNIEWLCAGECGPIIDVSDDTLMRKRIAELEDKLEHINRAYRAACSDSAKFAGDVHDAHYLIDQVRVVTRSLGIAPYTSPGKQIQAIEKILKDADQ